MTDTIVGILVALLGLLGLVLAGNAVDQGMYVFGLGLFAFGFGFIFFLVKKHFDRQEA
jgi:tellurite resistance protein TehA-like permease